MGKKKGLLRKVVKLIEAPVKFVGKLPRETFRIIDQGLDLGNKAIEKTGLDKVLSGGGSIGVSTTSGSRGGSNVYYQPAASASSIGIGLSNTGNPSLFVGSQVAVSLTTPPANFIGHAPETVPVIHDDNKHSINDRIAERDQLLKEVYGPGYIPESSLATIGTAAVVTASKQFLQDTAQVTNALSNLYLDTYVNIYSINDKQRSEAWTRNQELATNTTQAMTNVMHNPSIIITYYNNKFQNLADSFATAYDAGYLTAAGAATGEAVYDIYTMSAVTTGAAKTASKFIRANNFRTPLIFRFDSAQLNFGIPFDAVKLQNPVVPKPAKINITPEMYASFSKETRRLIGNHNRYKSQLFAREKAPKSATALNAARIELTGEQIPLAIERGVKMDHVSKVTQAQKGLIKHIKDLNNRISHPELSEIERKALQYELSETSTLLDYTEQFVPRPLPKDLILPTLIKGHTPE